MRKSVLSGVVDIIDKALGLNRLGKKSIGKAPHYRHRESCLLLSRRPPSNFNAKTLIREIYEKINSNLSADGSRSRENWRLEKIPAKKDAEKAKIRAQKKEVRLERKITEISDGWFNQVPTASGLVDERSDKRASIDLVHQCSNGSYELIELKVKSNNPLFAAMEILQYGILYILARTNKQVMNAAKGDQLLNAKVIHLKVLAPTTYYERFKLDWLESGINDGLKHFLAEKKCGFLMDFRFEAFPPNFRLSPFPKDEAIKEALENRRSVYS